MKLYVATKSFSPQAQSKGLKVKPLLRTLFLLGMKFGLNFSVCHAVNIVSSIWLSRTAALEPLALSSTHTLSAEFVIIAPSLILENIFPFQSILQKNKI